jgi:hypothetical protein
MNPRPISAAKGFLVLITAIVFAVLAQMAFERQNARRISPEVQKAVDAKLSDTLPETVPDSMRNSPAGRAYDSAVKGRVAE